MERSLGAAYQGVGWLPRQGDLGAELAEGRWWRPAGVDAEWGELRTAMLALPAPDWPVPDDWNAVQYMAPVDFGVLRDQLLHYADVLRRLGVEVLTRELRATRDGSIPYNGCFVRDQFFMTPQGAVVSRMASMVRAGEELATTQALAEAGVPVLATISGGACFEGADALWLRTDLVLLGVGGRTNAAGASQLSALLAEQQVEVRTVPVPRGAQHLLGAVQIVARDLAVVRTELTGRSAVRLLAELGVAVVEMPESLAVTAGQVMNFVPLGPRRVVMIDGAPAQLRLLEDQGIEVAAQVSCPELVKAVGGLACATGILWRICPLSRTVAGGRTRVRPDARREACVP